MIYITGDLHGDLSRLRPREIGRFKKGDTLIVCGDFGFVWDGSKKEEKILKKLGKKKYNILFVEGYNDNIQLIDQYPEEEWKNGRTRVISGNLRHLMRGYVFKIEDKKIFAFGGGQVGSRSDNLVSHPWHQAIFPTQPELNRGWDNLEKEDFKVDYIVTHQSSRQLKRLLTMEDNQASALDIYLDKVRERCDYTGWFFGGFHKDQIIPPKEMALFQKVIPLEEKFQLGLPSLKKGYIK